jgi:hypothetical protein
MWMNVIKSYQRKESEITKAACRRMRGGNPKIGRLYALHVKTMIGLAGRAPIQARVVGAIGALEPGDSPDGEGQNPVVEGADMLIGLWDWERVEGQLRCGWRNREVLGSREYDTPSKWHLDTQTANGKEASLDVYEGTGMVKSRITHRAAKKLGFSRNAIYHVCAMGIRARTWIRVRGVNSIHPTSVEGAKIGQPPIWDEPEVLLSQSDAEQLEGFLHSGWCRGRSRMGENQTVAASWPK